MGALQFLCVVVVLLGCCCCLAVWLLLDMWCEVDVIEMHDGDDGIRPPVFVPHVLTIGERADALVTPLLAHTGKIVRIRAVCHPRWFLDRENHTLAQVIERLALLGSRWRGML